MKTDIFLKTYRGDVPWLKHCLASIRKHWTGHRQVVLVCPPEDVQLVRSAGLVGVKLVPVQERGNPYYFQQSCKLNAHNYSDADYFIYVDSDCVFTRPTSPSTYIMPNGKPLQLYTPFTSPRVATALHWKAATERALGEPVDNEHMRRHPLVYSRETLLKLDRWFLENKGMAVSQFMLNFGEAYGLSEFCMMGAWAWKYAHEDFHWQSTETEPLPEDHLVQSWSWGGIDHPQNARGKAAIEALYK